MVEDLQPSDELRRRTAGRSVTLQLEYVRCGKAGCRRCPHGPYWYAYWSEPGRTRSAYVGKQMGKARFLANHVFNTGGRIEVHRDVRGVLDGK